MDKIKLMPMIYYSYVLIIILLILIIIISLILLYKKKITIKDKFILKIKILENKVNLKKISNKDAFTQLSKIIREYISKTTGTNVINYSLKEIKKLNNDTLTTLIEECYKYEFSNIKGDINKSITKAKELIK